MTRLDLRRSSPPPPVDARLFFRGLSGRFANRAGRIREHVRAWPIWSIPSERTKCNSGRHGRPRHSTHSRSRPGHIRSIIFWNKRPVNPIHGAWSKYFNLLLPTLEKDHVEQTDVGVSVNERKSSRLENFIQVEKQLFESSPALFATDKKDEQQNKRHVGVPLRWF